MLRLYKSFNAPQEELLKGTFLLIQTQRCADAVRRLLASANGIKNLECSSSRCAPHQYMDRTRFLRMLCFYTKFNALPRLVQAREEMN